MTRTAEDYEALHHRYWLEKRRKENYAVGLGIALILCFVLLWTAYVQIASANRDAAILRAKFEAVTMGVAR